MSSSENPDAALTPTQQASLRRTRSVAQLLDRAFTLPGTDYRIGIDAIVGIVPFVGDFLAGLLSLYIVLEALRLGAPKQILVRMLLNVVVDSLGGSVPIIGDVIDIAWKANIRNVNLLEQWLSDSAETAA